MKSKAPGWIKWCPDKDYLISLGVPFGNDFDEKRFWEKIYFKTKSIMASWGTIFALTLRGRVAVSNAMVYSRFRYWAQTMLMPNEILGWLSEDIHELIWSKDPKYKSGQHKDKMSTKADGRSKRKQQPCRGERGG